MTSLADFGYSLYKFRRYFSLGSFSVGDYEEINLGSSSSAIVAVESDLIEQQQMQQSIGDEFEEVFRSIAKNELETLPTDAAKEYSFIDCISMAAMKERKIFQILTNDHHFAQEGFEILM